MNIISFANAGKRNYGNSHWFWALWIGVEKMPDATSADEQSYRPYSTWNRTGPTASGFGSSRKEARRAVWTAMKTLIATDVDRCAYERGWASQLLSEERSDLPYFSRCKVGKDKWLWVVYSADRFWEERTPLARGIATSSESAHAAAVEVVGPVEHLGNHFAEEVRRREASMRRSLRTTGSTDASPVELVYECHNYISEFDSSSHDSITPHRIVKKTKQRIYVERAEYQSGRQLSGDWRDFVESTMVLDRAEFEATGQARASGRWYNAYYASPAIYFAERQSAAHRPECFIGLELPAKATTEEIRTAYRRLACKAHPDAGGDAAEFRQIHAWYEQAIELATAS